jgi:UPF0755 protein
MDGHVTVDGEPVTPQEPQAEAPRRGDDRRRVRRRRRLIAALVLVLVIAPLAWFALEAYPIGGTGAPAAFEVTQGESMGQVADAMAAKGIIGSALAFRLDLDVTGSPTVQPGWYVIPTSSSFSSVKGVLSAGPNASALGVYTGQTLREIAQNLSGVAGTAFAERFLALAKEGAIRSPFQPASGGSLEGLLAPGLFVISPGETPRTLLRQMERKFEARAGAAGVSPSTTVHGLNAYELLTVASIVEKEGYIPRNMPRTATVVYNRLARGTPLQMDATVEYATGQDGGTVTHATEQYPSPYNTYLHTGLTPTPICIPSTEAIAAALHAPSGPWLFFTLIDKSGTMAFSSTFAEQLANERLAQRRGL